MNFRKRIKLIESLLEIPCRNEDECYELRKVLKRHKLSCKKARSGSMSFGGPFDNLTNKFNTFAQTKAMEKVNTILDTIDKNYDQVREIKNSMLKILTIVSPYVGTVMANQFITMLEEILNAMNYGYLDRNDEFWIEINNIKKALNKALFDS
jgi:hypothetical protein